MLVMRAQQTRTEQGGVNLSVVILYSFSVEILQRMKMGDSIVAYWGRLQAASVQCSGVRLQFGICMREERAGEEGRGPQLYNSNHNQPTDQNPITRLEEGSTSPCVCVCVWVVTGYM